MPQFSRKASTPQANDAIAVAHRRAADFLDPAALMRIKNLELRARFVVQGFLSGLHRSPYHGFSVEFTEYRPYTRGDDPRYLDWRLYARSDRFYLKKFEDETNLRCHLLVDLSHSMGYRSVAYDKASYAKTAAATLAYFLSLQRDAVGLVTFDDKVQESLPARFRPGHLHRLLVSLERATSGKSTNLAAPLEQVAKTARKRGMVVLLSDLLAPLESLEKQLGYLRSQGHEVTVLRVLDPAEVDFPFQKATLFHDVESNREIYVDPDLARDQYRRRFATHAESLKTLCRRWEIDLYQLVSNEPLEMALFDLLNSRLRRRRHIARRGGARPAGQYGGGR